MSQSLVMKHQPSRGLSNVHEWKSPRQTGSNRQSRFSIMSKEATMEQDLLTLLGEMDPEGMEHVEAMRYGQSPPPPPPMEEDEESYLDEDAIPMMIPPPPPPEEDMMPSLDEGPVEASEDIEAKYGVVIDEEEEDKSVKLHSNISGRQIEMLPIVSSPRVNADVSSMILSSEEEEEELPRRESGNLNSARERLDKINRIQKIPLEPYDHLQLSLQNIKILKSAMSSIGKEFKAYEKQLRKTAIVGQNLMGTIQDYAVLVGDSQAELGEALMIMSDTQSYLLQHMHTLASDIARLVVRDIQQDSKESVQKGKKLCKEVKRELSQSAKVVTKTSKAYKSLQRKANTEEGTLQEAKAIAHQAIAKDEALVNRCLEDALALEKAANQKLVQHLLYMESFQLDHIESVLSYLESDVDLIQTQFT